MTKAQRAERDEAIQQLRERIKPGDTVYTVLDSVSRSGMSRQIRVVVPYTDQRICDCHSYTEAAPHFIGAPTIDHWHPNYSVAKAIGARQAKRGDGIIMGGCGMDMGFALVYELSQVLYGGRLIRNGDVTPDERREAPLITTVGAPEGYVYVGGYRCLGKGKCPSNYHVNHQDRIRCEGVELGRDEHGDLQRRRCYKPSPFGRYAAPADWPERIIEVGGERVAAGLEACLVGSGEDGRPYEVCPTCLGAGDVPNPDGPERFDLVHTDGYALRQRWL